MYKPIIGIVAPMHLSKDRPFKNYIKFINNFPKRIISSGGIPIGLLFSDGKFNEEEAKICDGFLIQGGVNVDSYSINVINYALKNKKPVLGICLGMQTMVAFEWITSKLGDDITYEQIDNYYNYNLENEFMENKIGHNNVNPLYEKDIDKSKHEVYLDKKSRIYNIFGNDVINMPSLHNQVVKEKIIKKHFKVTGYSKDKVVEAIESIDPNQWIVGVQFHPELEDKNNGIFKELIKQASKVKNEV